MTPEITAVSFAIQLPVDDFRAIVRLDKARLIDGTDLFAQLDKLPGVRDVEYNGHFGSCIYYTLDADHDGQHAPVLSAIKKYIARAKRS